MSLQKYIEKKYHKSKVNYDISEYKKNVQDICFVFKNKRELREYYIDLSELSKNLDFISYPKKFKLLLNICSPNESEYLKEFEHFFKWTSTRESYKIRRIEENITNIKSFYFLKEDVNLDDISFVVESKCSKALNKFKILDIYINEAIQETNWNGTDVIVHILTDNSAKIQVGDGNIFLSIDDNGIKYVSEEASNCNQDFEILRDRLFNPIKHYFDFYIQETIDNNKKINNFKRNFYLNKINEYFYFPLDLKRPEPKDGMDIWKIKLKLNQIIFEEGFFRVKDCLQKIRYLELESHES